MSKILQQLQYVPKMLTVSKPLAYLYYLLQDTTLDSNQFFKTVDFSEFDDDQIVEYMKQKLLTITSISKISAKLAQIDIIRNFSEDTKELIPKMIPTYEVKTYSMNNSNSKTLDNIVVWELNHIFPVMTGYFFELLLSHCLSEKTNNDALKLNVDNIDKCLRSKGCVIKIEQLTNIRDRWFVSKYPSLHVLRDHDSSDGDSEDGHTSPKSAETILASFKTIFHKILWASLLAYLCLNDYSEDVSDRILEMVFYIDRHNQYLEKYKQALEESSIFQILSREKHLQHSVSISDFQFNGEIDFLSNSFITDIKCYREPQEPSWFTQLYLYRQVLKNKTLGMRIVNFNNNTVYEFSTLETKCIEFS